jgi:hypothetical protein
MRLVAVSPTVIAGYIAAAAIPLLPLLLTEFPAAEILKRLASTMF